MAKQYYILSFNGPVGNDALWWRPEGKGYTMDLADAGKFDELTVRLSPGLYNNGEGTRAVPCEAADALVCKHVLWDDLTFYTGPLHEGITGLYKQ